jgi:hypothetical protein
MSCSHDVKKPAHVPQPREVMQLHQFLEIERRRRSGLARDWSGATAGGIRAAALDTNC